MIKIAKGFTLVELLVVVTIIGILATAIVVGYSTIQAGTRDSERSARVEVIAEALEKYYDANGEYPGCNAMTQSAQTVVSSTLVGMDSTVLAAPNAATGTNSITCSCLTQPSGGSYLSTCPGGGYISTDSYAYIGDGSTNCTTGAFCTAYTLQYRQESTGNIISLSSRRHS